MASGVKITDKATAVEAGCRLLERWDAEMMVVTLGEDGLVICSRTEEKGIFLDTVAREVFDVSGAGDSVTALFSAALSVGASPAVAGDLANIAAGIVVSEIGTVAASVEEIELEIERLLG